MGLKEVQKEMDDMAKALEEPSPGVEEFRTDAPGTEAPGTNAPATEAASTDAPGTAAPATDAPATSAPITKVPDEDPRDKEIRELREKLALREKTTKAPPTSPPPTKAPSTDAPIAEEDFLGELDPEELTRDPKAFNALLNKLYIKAVEFARGEVRTGSENVVRAIPDIVKNNVVLNATLKEINEKFYNENKDLVPFKKVVGVVFEELASQNPDKSYRYFVDSDETTKESILSKEVRKRLDLYKKAVTNKDDTPPDLPRKKGGQRQTTKPDVTPLQEEMDKMDKALGLD